MCSSHFSWEYVFLDKQVWRAHAVKCRGSNQSIARFVWRLVAVVRRKKKVLAFRLTRWVLTLSFTFPVSGSGNKECIVTDEPSAWLYRECGRWTSGVVNGTKLRPNDVIDGGLNSIVVVLVGRLNDSSDSKSMLTLQQNHIRWSYCTMPKPR